MLELARLAPGARVLELGAGSGDVALMASARVGAQGSVLATDCSEGMVTAARASAHEAGATNVRVEQMDAQALDVPAASFEAALARMVLMYLNDLPRALAGVLRALAPGGRFAATTWSALEKNPHHAALVEVARAYGPIPEPAPEVVRAFRLSSPDALRSACEAAGFREVEVRVVSGERTVPSIEAEVARLGTWPPVAALFAALDDATRARAWDEVARRWRAFEGPRGCVTPSEMLVLGASR